MTFKFTAIFLFFTTNAVLAQVQSEVNPPSNIKSIVFKGETDDQYDWKLSSAAQRLLWPRRDA